MKKLIFGLISVGLYAQTTVNLPTITVSADATTSINEFLPTQFSGNNTTLTSSVGVGDTIINVVSTTGIGSNNMLAIIDLEVVTITSKTATTLTVTRASIGTLAANHSNGIVARELRYKNFATLFLDLIKGQVTEIMELKPSGAIATQNAIMTTAQAAKAAAKSSAIQ